MKKPQLLFWFIIAATIFSIVIDLPKINNINFQFFLKSFIGERELSFRKGLDLEGGTSITLLANMDNIAKDQKDAAINSAKTVIERRVNLFGVSEPVVQTAMVGNEHRIIVEIPGVTDVNQAISLIGTTAKLEFRDVSNALASPSAFIIYETTKSTGLTGADLESAQASFDQSTGQPVVLFSVNSSSQDKFFEATTKLVGKQMAICLDQQCFSAPTVQQAIRDNGQITGGFTTEQARELATQLNAGALPVSLSVLEQKTIGPTLGEESLTKSFFAGFLGLITIIIFMSVLYGRLGILASFALLLYTLFMLAIFKISTLTPYGITLTLSGIAGFILSIGMAVDANILIFERMKEEQRLGKRKEVVLELGFARAWTSIRDSNVSTLITSLILYQFGTGIIRGFALVLAIGVLVSMFSAIVVTRTFLRMVYR
ncbi:MAG: protein-export membrane protein SecD [Candidatus Levybacteria bacterium RIFCSPHIGHO2_02_FULL_37_13]|nr:MAG: protein-export membrane protein SecD [Candidatus Levybacteria bacterium RIFCSPHIGHO2_02_FULL_37_13]OGH39655.1 MAG: protein-export membrane protein SecD [Candidatus Levybacteria bacterium RIFCSPLOWO2_01_FULL_37_26]